MESKYVFLHTASGCLTGIVCSSVFAVLGVLALMYVPIPLWTQVTVLVVMGVPVMLPAFIVDRRSSRDAKGNDSK